MKGFLEELKGDLQSRVPVIVWILVTLAVGATGPFGSYGVLSLSQRLLFWAPVMAVGVLVSTLIRAWAYGGLGLRGRLWGSVLSTGVITLVLSPPLLLINHLLFPGIGPGLDEVALLVASVSAGVCAIRHTTEAPRTEDAPPPAPQAVAVPRLLRRIEGADGALVSITVRDHYVDIATSAGTESLLMRFGDAIAEAEPVVGLKVHRSHWVAEAAVTGTEREGPKLFVRLVNGQRLPVSRANQAQVEARFGEAVSLPPPE